MYVWMKKNKVEQFGTAVYDTAGTYHDTGFIQKVASAVKFTCFQIGHH